MKVVTLLFLRQNNEILLAMKKRGFGEGKWNGVGGKVDPGETVDQATKRECREEIEVVPNKIQQVGRLHFFMANDKDFYHDARVYQCFDWKGTPKETEEMRPEWFKLHEIPYDSMWPDDEMWLPLLLDNKKFTGKFTLDNDSVENHKLRIVNSFSNSETGGQDE